MLSEEQWLDLGQATEEMVRFDIAWHCTVQHPCCGKDIAEEAPAEYSAGASSRGLLFA